MTTLLLSMMLTASAADHIDGPAAAADPAADITDLYAWHTSQNLIVALNFAGAGSTIANGTYDADVLYTVHIDTDGDIANGSERQIRMRFGQDGLGNWGIQVLNFPGAGAPVVGPVEAVITAPGGLIFAGVRNDPFNFDFEGFTSTITPTDSADPTSLTIGFTGVDFFAGLNVTSIVLQMDRNVVADGDTGVAVWATTGRYTPPAI